MAEETGIPRATDVDLASDEHEMLDIQSDEKSLNQDENQEINDSAPMTTTPESAHPSQPTSQEPNTFEGVVQSIEKANSPQKTPVASGGWSSHRQTKSPCFDNMTAKSVHDVPTAQPGSPLLTHDSDRHSVPAQPGSLLNTHHSDRRSSYAPAGSRLSPYQSNQHVPRTHQDYLAMSPSRSGEKEKDEDLLLDQLNDLGSDDGQRAVSNDDLFNFDAEFDQQDLDLSHQDFGLHQASATDTSSCHPREPSWPSHGPNSSESLFVGENESENGEVNLEDAGRVFRADGEHGLNLGNSLFSTPKVPPHTQSAIRKEPRSSGKVTLSRIQLAQSLARKNFAAAQEFNHAVPPRANNAVANLQAADIADERSFENERKILKAKIKKLESKQARKQPQGLDLEDDILLLKFTKQLENLERRHLMESDPTLDHENLQATDFDTPSKKRWSFQNFQQPLQPDEESDATQPVEDLFVDENDEEDDEQRPKKPSKTTRKREIDDGAEVGIEDRNDRTKRRKGDLPASKSAAKGKGKRGSKAQAKGDKPGKEKKAKRKGKPHNENLVSNIESLYAGDLVADAAGNNDVTDRPSFQSTVKTDAIKELIASIPIEERDMAKYDVQYLLRATKEFSGKGSCRSDGKGGWLIKGMKTSLTNYQVLGASFMRQRELGLEEPRGGILADQMGLGKTLQSLAVIMNGLTTRGDRRTTLIVAPAAICSQWFAEIERHCKPQFAGAVLKYYGGNRLATNNIAGAFEHFDIVITTYGEVSRSYPKAEPPANLTTAIDKNQWWRTYYKFNKGIFHHARFNRVILDEAHVIKNYMSRTSMACRALTAVNKWALSGTPILNKPTELYPDKDPQKLRRLHAILTKFLIRRTHRDKLFGMPLLVLPDAHEQIQYLTFNDFERAIYDVVRRRMIARVMKWQQMGDLNKNYSNIFVMLLRLRQLTCHVLLLETVMRDVLELEDYVQLDELAEREMKVKYQDEKAAVLRNLRKGLARQAKIASRKSNNFGEDPETEDAEPESPESETERFESYGSSRHGLEYDFRQHLKLLQDKESWAEIQEKSTCSLCGQPPAEPFLSSCFHVHCKTCIEEMQHLAGIREEEEAKCAFCHVAFRELRPVAHDLFNNLSSSDGQGQKKKGNKKRKRKNKDGDEEETALQSWIDIGETVLPSPKTIAIKAQLLNWFQQNPATKVIIYTQFVPMIKILAKICELEKWGYQKYYGGMTMATREQAVEDFGNDADCRVLLASLRCGSLGLNLTMASKVICVDPWWNYAVDQQAFGRVFRIGQQEKTHFLRLAISNTVDDAIMKMQAKKKLEIDQLMDGNRPRMSIKELVSLFGASTEGGNDEFILIDNKETLPNPEPMSDNEDMMDSM